METLEGVLERITFFSDESNYLVGRLSSKESEELLTFVGHFPSLQEGENLRLKGTWKTHPRYGLQFQVQEWEAVTPTTLQGLRKFLSSGLVRGVGPSTAELLVKHFGLETLAVIEDEPDRLIAVEGIGPKKAAMIHQSYLQQKEIKEVMLFLQSYQVSPALAVKLFKHYGARAIPLVKENPYRLAEDVYGIGFITADKIARQLGLPHDAPQRVRSAALYLLKRAADEGHVFLPRGEMCERIEELLFSETPPQSGSAAELIDRQLEELRVGGQLVCEKNPAGEEMLYSAPFYRAEKGAAEKLLTLLNRQLTVFSTEEEGFIGEIVEEENISLAAEQVEAIKGACENGVMVITGGPGTGKTTTIRTLLKLFQRYRLKTMLAAPTGRAAKRMTEATGMEAKTVHRLLEYSFKEGEGFRFQRDEHNTLSCQALIVDEASMLDLLLFHNLLKAVPSGCRLILVGDMDQLPSVGAGNVLRDIIEGGSVPCVRLQTIFRQAQESMIVVNAHRINQGKLPLFNKKDKDLFFVEEEDPQRVASTIVELCKQRLPSYGSFDPLEEIQVITPMRRTPVGVEALNRLLQEELNPRARHKQELFGGGCTFRLGDKVMQIRNNYEKEVFNGDIGRLTALDMEEGELVVSFPETLTAREGVYDLSELDELVLSYAISVHKSQGSEYPVVVMPVVTQHYILLQRNLLYTGITRARRLVVLIGTYKAVAIAVNNNKVEQRYSCLAERLQQVL